MVFLFLRVKEQILTSKDAHMDFQSIKKPFDVFYLIIIMFFVFVFVFEFNLTINFVLASFDSTKIAS